ncbi:MAG: sigma-54 dependent transcriptional regulator [Acidobacteriota bacterium]
MLRKKLNILLVDDDPSIRDMLSIVLTKENYNVLIAENGKSAIENLKKNKIELIISDIKMPDISGIELLKKIKTVKSSIPVIMITAFASTADAIEAMKLGAEDYVTKPFNLEELRIIIKKAIYKTKIENENIKLKSKLEIRTDFEKIIGKSKQMQEIYNLIETIAKTDSTVLIYGESGTGKELIAKAIHNKSKRVREQFVSINCGALPENLLESELFGHKKGSFTDAYADKKGLFVESDNGTLFLDEIGEMSQQMQVKLLRAIQEKKIRPVGDNREIDINSRIISATNLDLKESIKNSEFRSDLFYRLNVISIEIPPLRERKEDISLLIDHFINRFNKKFEKEIKGIEKYVMELFINYSWPGNIRELENYIERAVTLEKSEYITMDSIPQDLVYSFSNKYNKNVDIKELILKEGFDFTSYIDEISQNILTNALIYNNYNLKKTSEMLSLNYRSLRYLVKKYNIKTKS